MKIVFDKLTLQNAISPLLCAIATNTSLPSTEGIHIKTEDDGSCTLTSYDLTKGVRTKIKAEIYSGGNVIINAAKLSQIVKVMPGDITIDVDSNYKAKISSGKSEFSLSVLPGENFSPLPDLRGERGFEISQDIFRKMINQTLFAAAVADFRPQLNGVYCEITKNKVLMVGCDSFKLAIKSAESDIENRSLNDEELNFKFIIPTKTLQELLRLMNKEKTVKVMMTIKHIIFFLEDVIFFSRLIDSDYLSYERFIPTDIKAECIVDRDAFLGSLERSSLITEDRAIGQEKSGVRLSVEANSLIVSSTSVSGSSFDEISSKNTGDLMKISFNCKYLLDTIRATECEKLRLSFSTPLTGMTIRPVLTEENDKNDDFTFMVTPVRTKDL